jgi:NAD(P)-dependent dehydrogenase (short-subunit alcohol dehydrogenase family)
VIVCALIKEAGSADVEREITGKQGITGYPRHCDFGTPDVSVIKLDLADFASIKKCAANVLQEESRLDFLLLNAVR